MIIVYLLIDCCKDNYKMYNVKENNWNLGRHALFRSFVNSLLVNELRF